MFKKSNKIQRIELFNYGSNLTTSICLIPFTKNGFQNLINENRKQANCIITYSDGRKFDFQEGFRFSDNVSVQSDGMRAFLLYAN